MNLRSCWLFAISAIASPVCTVQVCCTVSKEKRKWLMELARVRYNLYPQYTTVLYVHVPFMEAVLQCNFITVDTAVTVEPFVVMIADLKHNMLLIR